MDEKKFERETKQNREETEKYRSERIGRDRATHSENHSWEYDHKTGILKQKKGR